MNVALAKRLHQPNSAAQTELAAPEPAQLRRGYAIKG